MLHIPREEREPISMGDIVITDGKREHVIRDFVFTGNDKDLIWKSDYHRERIIEKAFKTKARIKTQRINPKLRILSIHPRISLGLSNVSWGCTKF